MIFKNRNILLMVRCPDNWIDNADAGNVLADIIEKHTDARIDKLTVTSDHTEKPYDVARTAMGWLVRDGNDGRAYKEVK